MTELIWDGKYKEGKKVAPVRIPLPFQTIETVNESAQERQRTLDMFARGRQTEWRNRLIWGDKKYVLPSLLPEFAGKVNLIYIDPPFDTGADFSFKATLPDNPETEEDETTTFTKQPSVIEQKAYRDTWGRGLDSYLQWFYETATLLRELLAENGSVYVHLDWHVAHYAKAVLDEVFGYLNFVCEIVWHYSWGVRTAERWNRKHDNILMYQKTESITFNADSVLEERALSESTRKRLEYKGAMIRDWNKRGRAKRLCRQTFGMLPRLMQWQRKDRIMLLRNLKPFWNASSKPPRTKVIWCWIALPALEQLLQLQRKITGGG